MAWRMGSTVLLPTRCTSGPSQTMPKMMWTCRLDEILLLLVRMRQQMSQAYLMLRSV